MYLIKLRLPQSFMLIQIKNIFTLNFLCFKKHIILFIIGLIFSTYYIGQTTTTIDFETAGSGYTPSVTNGNGTEKVFNRTNTDMVGVSNEDGFYWACEDLDVIDPSIMLNQIDITGSSSFSFYIDMVAHHFDKWDIDDELKITYSIDGGAFQNLIWIQSMAGNNKDTPPGIDLAFDGNGDCGTLTSLPAITNGVEAASGCNISSADFQTFSKTDVLLSGNSTLDIKLEFFDLDKKDEGLYLDNIIISQTSVLNTWNGSVSTSWLNVLNWDLGVVPSSLDNVVIPNVINQPVVSSNVEVSSLTVDIGASITVSSNTFLVTDNSVIDGSLNIDLGTYDADGSFNASNGAINFTNNGFLVLSSSSVTSLGALNSNIGTVKYDGANAQSVLSDTYFNLSIENSSTKTVTGNLDLNGSLTIEDKLNCILDLDSKRLRIKGNLTVGSQGYLDASDTDCNVVFRGADSKNVKITDFTGTSSFTIDEIIMDGTASWNDAPLYADRDFGYTRCIYSETEIGNSNKVINKLSVFVVNPTNFNFTASIYIKNIGNKTEFTGADDNAYPTTASYTQVLNNATIVFNTAGWFDIDITNYSYSGSGSLEILFENNTGNHANNNPVIGHFDNASDGLTENRMIYNYANGTFPNGAANLGQFNVDMRFNSTTETPVIVDASFNDLKVNGGGDLTLSSPTKINGILTLNNGNIISSATNTLTLENTLTTAISGGSVSSHIVGPLNRNTNSIGDYILPVGDGIHYRPIVITPNSTTTTTYTAEFKNTAHSSVAYDANGFNNTPTTSGDNIDHVAMGCWWDIERTASGSDCFVALNWDNTSGVDSPSDIILAHWNGLSWDKIGTTLSSSDGTGSATAADGRVKSNLFTGDFSPFNLGSGNGNNSLPIDLLSFTTTCYSENIEVEFSVLSQVNNDYFIIEKSLDAYEWEFVAELQGAGNTNTQMNYSFTDYNSYSNLSYYRLRQIDYDGNLKIFYPVSANCNNSSDGVMLNVYPNPVRDHITFELDLDRYQGDESYYSIIDAAGKVIISDYINLENGFNKKTLDVSKLMSGIYFIQLNQTKDPIKTARIIVR